MAELIIVRTENELRVQGQPLTIEAVVSLLVELGLPLQPRRMRTAKGSELSTVAFDATGEQMELASSLVEEWARQRAGSAFGVRFEVPGKTIFTGLPD